MKSILQIRSTVIFITIACIAIVGITTGRMQSKAVYYAQTLEGGRSCGAQIVSCRTVYPCAFIGFQPTDQCMCDAYTCLVRASMCDPDFENITKKHWLKRKNNYCARVNAPPGPGTSSGPGPGTSSPPGPGTSPPPGPGTSSPPHPHPPCNGRTPSNHPH